MQATFGCGDGPVGLELMPSYPKTDPISRDFKTRELSVIGGLELEKSLGRRAL